MRNCFPDLLRTKLHGMSIEYTCLRLGTPSCGCASRDQTINFKRAQPAIIECSTSTPPAYTPGLRTPLIEIIQPNTPRSFKTSFLHENGCQDRSNRPCCLPSRAQIPRPCTENSQKKWNPIRSSGKQTRKDCELPALNSDCDTKCQDRNAQDYYLQTVHSKAELLSPNPKFYAKTRNLETLNSLAPTVS